MTRDENGHERQSSEVSEERIYYLKLNKFQIKKIVKYSIIYY